MGSQIKRFILRWVPPLLFLTSVSTGVYFFVLKPDQIFEKSQKHQVRQKLERSKEQLRAGQFGEAEDSLKRARKLLDRFELGTEFEKKHYRLFHRRSAENIWRNIIRKKMKESPKKEEDFVVSRLTEDDGVLSHAKKAREFGYPEGQFRKTFLDHSTKLWEEGFHRASNLILEKLIEDAPGDFSMKKRLVKRYLTPEATLQKKHLDRVRQFVEKAGDKGKTSLQDFFSVTLARLLVQQGKPEEASKYFQDQKNERDGEFNVSAWKEAEFHLEIGRHFLNEGNLQKAEEQFDRGYKLVEGARKSKPKHLSKVFLYYRALVRLERGERKGTVSDFSDLREEAAEEEQELEFASAFQMMRIRLFQISEKSPSLNRQKTFFRNFRKQIEKHSKSVVVDNQLILDWQKLLEPLRNVILSTNQEVVLQEASSLGEELVSNFPDSPQGYWITGFSSKLQAEIREKSFREQQYSRLFRGGGEEQAEYKGLYSNAATNFFEAAKLYDFGHERFIPLLKRAARASNKAELPALTEQIITYSDDVATDPKMKVIRGEAYRQAGKTTLAARQFRDALQNARVLTYMNDRFPGLQLGRMYREEGKLQKAKETFQKNKDILNEIGLSNYHPIWKKNFVELLQTEVLLAKNTGSGSGREQHISAARRLYREEKAFLTSGNRGNDPSPGVMLRTYYYMGNLRELRQLYSKAADSYRLALQYAGNQHPETEVPVSSMPKYRSILQSIYKKWPHLLKRAGRNQEALGAYREALNSKFVRKLPEKADMQLGLVDLLSKLNQDVKARSHLQTSGELLRQIEARNEAPAKLKELQNRLERLRNTIFAEE